MTWLPLITLACSSGREVSPTPPATRGQPRHCGNSFSPQCAVFENQYCIDPGPYVFGEGSSADFVLQQFRYFRDNVHQPNDYGYRCYSYVARECDDEYLVYANNELALLVGPDGTIQGRAMTGDGWYQHIEIDIAFECGLLYNGPLSHDDCVISAFEEAQTLSWKCNLYQPCDLGSCIIDEVP